MRHFTREAWLFALAYRSQLPDTVDFGDFGERTIGLNRKNVRYQQRNTVYFIKFYSFPVLNKALATCGYCKWVGARSCDEGGDCLKDFHQIRGVEGSYSRIYGTPERGECS